ncbi:hypothetical protein [Bythopirellula polymerisocia]|nr:hypothetical protein [Bythopirellula polymerisocia]
MQRQTSLNQIPQSSKSESCAGRSKTAGLIVSVSCGLEDSQKWKWWPFQLCQNQATANRRSESLLSDMSQNTNQAPASILGASSQADFASRGCIHGHVRCDLIAAAGADQLATDSSSMLPEPIEEQLEDVTRGMQTNIKADVQVQDQALLLETDSSQILPEPIEDLKATIATTGKVSIIRDWMLID